MYWAHAKKPPSVRKLASSFGDFMEEFLEYSSFEDEDA
jgi:hypothetical protein